jgi:hypothetical protein
MNPHIKKSNVLEIDKHIKDVFSSKIQENKLFALLKLVDKKGSPIEAPGDEFLNGIKVIEYKKGYYIGFIKNVYQNGSFMLKTISLKA